MMKKMAFGIVMAGLCGTAMAQSAPSSTVEFSDHARVVAASPVYEEGGSPVRVCDQAGQPAAGHNMAGEVIGGLVGGLAGHQIGNGRGNTAATIVGALGGAYAGGKVESNMTAQQAQENCHMEDSGGRQLAGYRVTLRYAGHRFTEMMQERPRIGSSVRVHTTVSVE